jgi:hypothetical protein
MADIDLHLFEEDLQKRPARGSNAPPVSIRAKDLDGNFKKVTVIDSEKDPPEYVVEYTDEGVILKDFLAQGENTGDLLYWDGDGWEILSAPQDDKLRVLTIQSGNLEWIETEDCE